MPELRRQMFTNDSGAFTISDAPAGQLTIQVRRIGYVPHDTTVDVKVGGSPIRIELSQVSLRLDVVNVHASACSDPGVRVARSDTALVTALQQMQMNADQLRILSEQYPFETKMETTRTVKDTATGTVTLAVRDTLGVQSGGRWHYKPGQIVTRGPRGGYRFNMPTLSDFADARFLDEHCFSYVGIDSVNGLPMVRVDFLAAARIKTPDVNGSLYFDPDNFQIRRTVLQLSRLPNIRALTSYEVTTEFREIMESVPIIHHIFAIQSFDTTARRRHDAVYEEWRLLQARFVGQKPGDEMIRAVSPPRP